MEPRFSIPDTTPRSSKLKLVIGGVKVYIYGLEKLKISSGVEIGVLYLAHMRTRTYLVTEAIAHEVLHQYRTSTRNKCELIAITMDMRNHGEREVSHSANLTWKDGNENHAMDLLSTISGSAQDFKLVIDYLPIYFPQFTRFHNIMLGISLGGHTAYRLAALSPSQIKGYAIVVGCPSLGSLLLNRLGIDATALGSTTAELGNVDYDRLEKVMDEEQKRRWPRSLSTLIREGDREVHDNFPADTPLLLCNGKQDPLVPSFYTVSWLESRRENVLAQGEEKKMKLFVQDNTGHSCTKEMVAMISAWIGSILEPLSTGNTLLRPESHL